jgi:hypothetical protein
MHASTRIVTALEQFKGLFFEQPTARLSVAEAREFSGLDEDICDQLLGALVDVRFLTQGKDGAYQRRAQVPGDDVRRGDVPRRYPTMATVNPSHGSTQRTSR